MATVRSSLAIALIALSACAQNSRPRETGLPQARVSAISIALTQNQIGRVEILQIPPQILTRAQITPEMLERQYHNKLVIRDFAATGYRQAVIKAFTTISVEPRGNTADLRWGVIFYSRDDARLGAIYFDRSGRFGAVDDKPVTVKGEFFHWLDSTFSNCMQ